MKKLSRAFCSLKIWFWHEFAVGISAEMTPDWIAKRSNQAVGAAYEALGANRLRGTRLPVGIFPQLCRVPIVVSQHPTKSLAAFNLARDLPDFFTRIDDLVFETLVISLFVIVQKILANSSSQ